MYASPFDLDFFRDDMMPSAWIVVKGNGVEETVMGLRFGTTQIERHDWRWIFRRRGN
jgi:hypothetical protein